MKLEADEEKIKKLIHEIASKKKKSEREIEAMVSDWKKEVGHPTLLCAAESLHGRVCG